MAFTNSQRSTLKRIINGLYSVRNFLFAINSICALESFSQTFALILTSQKWSYVKRWVQANIGLKIYIIWYNWSSAIYRLPSHRYFFNVLFICKWSNVFQDNIDFLKKEAFSQLRWLKKITFTCFSKYIGGIGSTNAVVI